MKKTLLALSLASSISISGPTVANTILGVYVGGGIWQADYDGDITGSSVVSENFSFDELGLDEATNNFFYAALEHPVPVIPNIRIQYTAISSEEDANIERNITLDGQTFDLGADISTDLDLSHTDVTLYYEILDNWISIDLGLTARIFDGEIQLTGPDPDDPTRTQTAEEDLNVTVPMIYAKGQFDLPFTGWFVGANLNIISVSGNTLSDVEAKVGYMSDELPVLDIGFELGYRQLKLEVDEFDDDLEAEITLDGPYASLVLHF